MKNGLAPALSGGDTIVSLGRFEPRRKSRLANPAGAAENVLAGHREFHLISARFAAPVPRSGRCEPGEFPSRE